MLTSAMVCSLLKEAWEFMSQLLEIWTALLCITVTLMFKVHRAASFTYIKSIESFVFIQNFPPKKFCMVYFREDRRTGVLPAPVPWERVMKQCAWAPHRAGMWTWKAANHPLWVPCQNKRGMPQVLLFPLSGLACLKRQLFQRFNLKCVFLSWRYFVKNYPPLTFF